MPDKLYKYRPFHINSLRSVIQAEVFYAKPKTFNDPLDCDPTIEIDISRPHLENLLYQMLLRTRSEKEAEGDISRLRYYSTEYGDYRKDETVESYLKTIVANKIKDELDDELGNEGVLALSSTWASALMWSHYADEHKGICIEYDTRDQDHPRLAPVNYRAPRAVKTSDLWLWKAKGDNFARQRVFDTYFYSKSSEWKYEKEWRDVSDKSGVRGVPFRITAILFGLRCDPSIITSFVRLLSDHPKIKLWQMLPKDDSFALRREQVDREEVQRAGIREPSFLLFKDLVWDENLELVDELKPAEDFDPEGDEN
ncbi:MULTISPECIES: DUF2971 domain-containing protein [Sphingomonas]|uniref:DUF2971 domain-containing protein n=1 Tax=Sphingomonas TaxID=13687 RepID=UPI002862B6D4|nr:MULTISPECIES: DUF2971 domain-containing protein [unclassified Sphingomonas]MDR6114119.1 hypothetical protein [Sphingomonas sp. SORGH_AS_0789]MDR6148521.1 hypothetical protein [Sphingomonas sp. SORGH_AS_0742]